MARDYSRLPAHEVIAVGHRNGEVLVRHGDELGRGAWLACEFYEGFDDRRKVCAGIGEDVIDPAALQCAQE